MKSERCKKAADTSLLSIREAECKRYDHLRDESPTTSPITQAHIFPSLFVVFIPSLSPLAEVRNLPLREIKQETEGLRKAAQSGSTDQSRKHILTAVSVSIWLMTFITQSSTAILV